MASARTPTAPSSRRRCSSTGRSISTCCRSTSCCWRASRSPCPGCCAGLISSSACRSSSTLLRCISTGTCRAIPTTRSGTSIPWPGRSSFTAARCWRWWHWTSLGSTAGDGWSTYWRCSICFLPPLSPCPGSIIRWNASFRTGLLARSTRSTKRTSTSCDSFTSWHLPGWYG